MITIGLTNWNDHPLIAPNPKTKLEDYASHFPFVEMDTSFYGIPSKNNIQNWINKTPATFKFIPKAYAPMTLHKPWKNEFNNLEELFDTFKIQFYPMLAQDKLKAFLFQFPPFFRYNSKNIDYLKIVGKLMGTLPVAIEFRHSSWLNQENKKETMKLLKNNFFIYTVVDEPQTPNNSSPTILTATNNQLALYRLHGQNYSGWLNAGDDPNWRENRTLHDYTKKELTHIKNNTLQLSKQTKEVAVIFNNNSGGHAAKNAKELKKMLNLHFEGLNPQQLNLF